MLIQKQIILHANMNCIYVCKNCFLNNMCTFLSMNVFIIMFVCAQFGAVVFVKP